MIVLLFVSRSSNPTSEYNFYFLFLTNLFNGRNDTFTSGFGTQFSVPFKIMINCPLLTSHNFLCDFAAPLRYWSPTILVICLSENRKEKACSTSRFQAILFPVSHSPKITCKHWDQLSITRRYGNCIPTQTKNSSHQSALFFTCPQTHI